MGVIAGSVSRVAGLGLYAPVLSLTGEHLLADEEISKLHEVLSVILEEIRSAKKIQIPEPVDGTIVDGIRKEGWPSLADIEKVYVTQVLRHTRGNKQAASRILNMDRKTLDRTIKRHNLNLSEIQTAP